MTLAPSIVRFGITTTLVVLVLTSAGPSRATAGTPHTANRGATTPLCSLYVVTLTTEVLITDFNSPSLSYNAKKWPLLMAQARNARLAFSVTPLLSVRDRYDSLVDRLRVIGAKLIAGSRKAAYVQLKASRPDLNAVTAVAEHAHLACRAGTSLFYIR